MAVEIKAAPNTHRCTRCGVEFSPELHSCPACGRVAGNHSSRITLAVTLLLIFCGAGFTQYFVNLHRATEFELANRWFVRGGDAMRANLPSLAADDYRTALSYDPDNAEYRLRLAQALLAANRLNEARAHLTSLWEQEPANGEVNLTLARLYAKRGDFNNATRYYSNAINGTWNENPRKQRVAIRFELSNYLLQQKKLTQAQSELMALLADRPREPADQLHLGQMLLQVNEPEHTIEVANGLLAANPSNAQALFQKGQALLAMGNYVDAEHAVSAAVDHDPNLDGARGQLELLREMLRVDVTRRGLTRKERAARAVDNFQTALKRLQQCATQRGITLADQTNPTAGTGAGPVPSTTTNPVGGAPPSPLQLLYSNGLQKEAAVNESGLRDDPDALDAAMQYVFEVERTTAPICPSMSPTDQALLVLAQHESETPR